MQRSRYSFTRASLAAAVFSTLATLLATGSSRGEPAKERLTFHEALYSGPISRMGPGRSAVSIDPILYGYVTGELAPPHEGDQSGTNRRGREQHWERIVLDESGAIKRRQLRGGYVYLACEAPQSRSVVLEPNGAAAVFVNGTPRAGDIYAKDWMVLPVKLRKGLNEIWFEVARGRNKSVRITLPPKPVYLTTKDATFPDFLTAEANEKWAAIRVVNATDKPLNDLAISAEVAGVVNTTQIPGTITPMTTRKIPFRVQDVAKDPGDQTVRVSLFQDNNLVDAADVNVEVKEPSKNYRRTFLSGIDGSVQYYAVRQGKADEGRKPALFLSVHGAGVKAIGQAGSYQSKDWGHVIAPTNRREFGFDWEDWGRLDAMEVLADAESSYQTDPDRTYLTGHSMGGHGAWYLGATYPDRWAAIAPMAGWRSFFSYGRTAQAKESNPMAALMNRAANPSRTLELLRNYRQFGVYIEHGDSDQTVPVEEARFMREHLATFHPDFVYFEEPGGGHWYGVDHPALFDYFKRHVVKDIRDLGVLEFRTACPGISADCRYITLYQQEEPYEFCGVVAKQTVRSRRQRRNGEDISKRKIEITTENLSVFKVNLDHCHELQELTMEVDGQFIKNLPWPDRNEIWLRKLDGRWQIVDRPSDPSQKHPQRYGGFKDAFRRRMVFVYSTHGNDEENALSYDKARFDAETFYYRGNGSIDIIPDGQFALDAFKDRSVILYGNADTNGAWNLLLDDCPIQVRRDEIIVGDRILNANDLGLYMVRPRKDSAIASVGVVAGTGTEGLRAVVPNRYFVAGTGYPDFMVVSPELYSRGTYGIKVAGYFGNDWSIENGSIVWQEE